MTLPASGDITIGDLATEFGADLPKSLGNFYRGGGIVPEILQTVGVPASGTIGLTDFYGKGNVTGLASWSYDSMFINRSWGAAAFGNGRFVALADIGYESVTSTDGITWTWGGPSAGGSGDTWGGIAFGNGVFVAVLKTGLFATYSTNGASWTGSTGMATGNWQDVSYGNGTFVAVGTGAVKLTTSPSGAVWTSRTSPVQTVTTLAYGANLFVAMSNTGTLSTYLTSTDGVTWTQRSLPVSGNWRSVRFGLGMFVAIPTSGATGLYSADGLTWATFTLPASGAWTALSAGAYGFFAAIPNSTQAASSADGISWVSRTLSGSSYAWKHSMQGLGIALVISGSWGDANISYT